MLTGSRARRLSQQWFENYGQLQEILSPQDGETGAGYKRIKIAVLDTGIKPNEYQYLKEYGTIEEYQDYVDTVHGGVPNDETGHGSAAVCLLAKTCPNASLYLARVLKTNKPTSPEVENVVKV